MKPSNYLPGRSTWADERAAAIAEMQREKRWTLTVVIVIVAILAYFVANTLTQ